jgi:hypothetical protein
MSILATERWMTVRKLFLCLLVCILSMGCDATTSPTQPLEKAFTEAGYTSPSSGTWEKPGVFVITDPQQDGKTGATVFLSEENHGRAMCLVPPQKEADALVKEIEKLTKQTIPDLRSKGCTS